jgi:serine protease
MILRKKPGCFRFRIGIKSAFWVLLTLMVMGAWGCGGGGDGGTTPDDTDSTTVSFSGTISAPDGVTIDSDVNDPNESYASNDTLGAAQDMVSPVSIGGYVNRANYGASGRSYASGDLDDYFSVSLTTDDKITLAIGDPDEGDLDLYLFDSSGTQVGSSLGVDRYESLTISADGDYFICVYAYSGASNYILTIGTDFDTGSVDALSTQYDFVPGQAIVRFKDSVAAAAATDDRVTAMGLTLTAGAADREVLLSFDAQDLQAEVYQSLGVTKHLSVGQATADTAMAEKINTLQVIKALRKRSDVRSASPNYILQHCATPNDEFYSLQWHYPQINLPQAWELTTGSSDVIVAVVDTGVLMNHPDLSGQLTDTGYDFISDSSISNDGGGIDANPDDPGDSATPGSSSFHGTHCAGTIAASSNNSTGVAGVSWNTKIMPIRVLGVGGGTVYDILQGVRYAAGLSNDSNTVPDQTADIISMSLGGGSYDQTSQDVYTEVRNAGVILIAAAGNESTSTPSYPASYDGIVSVSAVNINGTLASYSNYGSYVDVAAPGGDSGDYDGDGYADKVWSTCGDDSSGSIQFNYAAYNGTSMATPHMAGVVALMKALNPTMTPAQLDAWLQNGDLTNDIGDTGRDDLYGYGLIDAYKAVVAANNGSPTTVLTVSPTSVNLGVSSTTATLTVSKIGDDTISVTGVVDSAAWLTVAEGTVDANGLGTYTLTADRSGLSDGTYSETVTVTPSSGSSITVPVNLQVRSTSASANAGYHYVLLVDADTFDVLYQDDVQASNGQYAFAFSGIPKAEQNYLLVAGSDRDNDNYIDNAGEALGAYLSLDQITYVEASSNQSGLDFATDLKLSLSASSLAVDDSDGTALRFKRLK